MNPKICSLPETLMIKGNFESKGKQMLSFPLSNILYPPCFFHCKAECFTGVKKVMAASDGAFEIHLQLSNLMKDIPISSLSDDNFYEVSNY